MADDPDITQLLVRWKQGDERALDQLLPLVYDELRSLARSYLRRERRDHTLQPTALVHELFIRFAREGVADWHDRAHFFGIAARGMRQILVSHARRHGALKRGGVAGMPAAGIRSTTPVSTGVDLVALDAALCDLAQRDQRQAQIVEFRVFGGYTIDETAQLLGCSPATVSREWQTARIWLYRELRDDARDA